MDQLQELERALAAHGGPAEDAESLPPEFREKLVALREARAGSPRVEAERQAHLDRAAWLVRQLDSADNDVVKMQKCRVICAELNAVKAIDGLGGR